MNVVILEDAAEDLESGAQFYESCATGVGDYFLDSILSDLDSLVLFAGVHPIYFGFHRMLSKRFPFGIYYEVEDDVIYVYAILDLRRDPLWIRKRLRDRSLTSVRKAKIRVLSPHVILQPIMWYGQFFCRATDSPGAGSLFEIIYKIE